MVKQELVFWSYLWKTKFLLIVLPILFIPLAFFFDGGALFNELAMLLVFPCLIFPIIALLSQIGSAGQKELLLTFPLNIWQLGFSRPLGLAAVYASIFAIVLNITGAYAVPQIFAAAAAVMYYMMLTSFCMILFKNTALAIIIPIAYLIFGLFTTGSGQDVFYIMQWGRANPDISLIGCMITQFVVALIFALLGPFLLKRRNRWFIGV